MPAARGRACREGVAVTSDGLPVTLTDIQGNQRANFLARTIAYNALPARQVIDEVLAHDSKAARMAVWLAAATAAANCQADGNVRDADTARGPPPPQKQTKAPAPPNILPPAARPASPGDFGSECAFPPALMLS